MTSTTNEIDNTNLKQKIVSLWQEHGAIPPVNLELFQDVLTRMDSKVFQNILVIGELNKSIFAWQQYFSEAQIYCLVPNLRKQDWKSYLGDRLRFYFWNDNSILETFKTAKTLFSLIVVPPTIVPDKNLFSILFDLVAPNGHCIFEHLKSNVVLSHKDFLSEKEKSKNIKLLENEHHAGVSLVYQNTDTTEYHPPAPFKNIKEIFDTKNHFETQIEEDKSKSTMKNLDWPYSLTLVTAIVSLDKFEKRPVGGNLHDYLSAFEHIKATNIPIVVFVDGTDQTVKETIKESHHIKVINITQDNSYLGYHLKYDFNEFAIPSGSNPVKDTVNYFLTQFSKFSWLKYIAQENPFKTSHVGWIDMGAMRDCKLLEDNCQCSKMPVPEIQRYLKTIARIPQTTKIRVPSPHKGITRNFSWQHPYWWWSGNFLIAETKTMIKLSDLFEQEVHKEWFDKKQLTWEINVLGYLACKYPELIELYPWSEHLSHTKNFYQTLSLKLQ